MARVHVAGDSVVSDIKRSRGQAHFVYSDMTEYSSFPGVIQQVVDQTGSVDILVNNAGVFDSAHFKRLPKRAGIYS